MLITLSKNLKSSLYKYDHYFNSLIDFHITSSTKHVSNNRKLNKYYIFLKTLLTR